MSQDRNRRVVQSAFDAGDSAMLTFLLDIQDGSVLWQSGPGRPEAERSLSLQPRCSPTSAVFQPCRAIVTQPARFDRQLSPSDAVRSRISSHPGHGLGTTSAYLHPMQRSVFWIADSACSALHRLLRFANCVRCRATPSSFLSPLAQTPFRSHS